MIFAYEMLEYVSSLHQNPQEFFGRGNRGPPGESFQWGVAAQGSGPSPLDAGKVFKILKSNEKINDFYVKISIIGSLNGKFAIFQFFKFSQFFAKTSATIQKNAFVGGSGRIPRNYRIYGKISRNTNGNLQFFEIFHKFRDNIFTNIFSSKFKSKLR